jgi:hypothetical protein
LKAGLVSHINIILGLSESQYGSNIFKVNPFLQELQTSNDAKKGFAKMFVRRLIANEWVLSEGRKKTVVIVLY